MHEYLGLERKSTHSVNGLSVAPFSRVSDTVPSASTPSKIGRILLTSKYEIRENLDVVYGLQFKTAKKNDTYFVNFFIQFLIDFLNFIDSHGLPACLHQAPGSLACES